MVPVLQDIDNDLYTAEMNELDGKPFYGVIVTDKVTGVRVCYEVCDVMKYWSWNIDAPTLSGDPAVTGYTELAPGESKTVTERIFVR